MLCNHIIVSDVVITVEENVQFSLRQSISGQFESLQASVLKVFFRAAALTLGENAEHELNLAVQGSQLSCNGHDNLSFKLFAENQIL